jgi:hypothetical protein
MNPLLGWGLAALVMVTAWQAYGWQGAAFAATVVVFWLLLQFNRSIRVMKNAASAPMGHVGSAVMLNAQLKRGMTMLALVSHTKSLGRKVSDEPESWAWSDDSGAVVTVVLKHARVDHWTLTRDG